ncbi:hypothetical protein F0562_028171 [Nyssa sinensis]|uniref:Uncharacterized protein n=1 Tax=Nyssa sinensis TaxID=561372 RepID=A0A5J5B5V3_9ASTE|nr:hypothetical protein F0562_028171 [Nyssa sinensis]
MRKEGERLVVMEATPVAGGDGYAVGLWVMGEDEGMDRRWLASAGWGLLGVRVCDDLMGGGVGCSSDRDGGSVVLEVESAVVVVVEARDGDEAAVAGDDG